MDASFTTYNQINYNITLPDRITDVKTVTVESVEIPMSFHNISANLGNNCFKIFNNTLYNDYYTYNPADAGAYNAAYAKNYVTTIIVPDGYYTAATLVNAINAEIDKLAVTNIEPNPADLRIQIDANNHAVFYSNESTYTIYFDVNQSG
jgi:hypothetical protein